MGTIPDPLLNFLQLCWQVIQVITALILLIHAYFLVRYARAHDAFLQHRLRKEQMPPAPSKTEAAGAPSSLVVERPPNM
jgi:hypothetical protein